MEERSDLKQQGIGIEDLYPQLSSEQQAEAAYRLKQYLELVERIFERVSDLTDSK